MSRPRARDLGLDIGTLPSGPLDAITDVDGIRVASVTLIEGDDVRTGVTVVVAHDGREPLFAGAHRLNGNGELTGLEWIREAGCLSTPVGLTNTHSVGVVRDAIVAIDVAGRDPDEVHSSLPVVGETWDGVLNEINGFHVRPEHVHEAFVKARAGPVEEGGAGSGTGMICHGFKGGLGTASRVADDWTVGVLVQANHGRRDRLTARCCRTSAGGSRSAARSASAAPAERARRPAGTSSSRSARCTRGCRRPSRSLRTCRRPCR